MNVFILATCRKPELWPMTELVFKTLRIGFPTAKVTVFNNDLSAEHRALLETACKAVDAEVLGTLCHPSIHHTWIEELARREKEPFYVLDTDVIFYESFERFTFETALAGWRIPEWKDEFTNAITRARLHTSLLYVNPELVREAVSKYEHQFPETPFNPLINLFHPVCMPFKQRGYFYDTCSLLYHAIGGTAFTPDMLDSYFHFHWGTIPDVVLPHLQNRRELQIRRESILENHPLGRGLWREAAEYFSVRPAVYDGMDVIAPITNGDAAEAVKWNMELCRGNQKAMNFCDMWYQYCHGIDDLVDTLEDGRPTMSKEQIISLFLKAAVFYNSPFFVEHRDLLFPIALQTTNTYADSVAWENSPKEHLRIMGDVFRTCGNEMYFMVALICGGEAHMRKMSQTIKERDWLGQHDAAGRPT